MTRSQNYSRSAEAQGGLGEVREASLMCGLPSRALGSRGKVVRRGERSRLISQRDTAPHHWRMSTMKRQSHRWVSLEVGGWGGLEPSF